MNTHRKLDWDATNWPRVKRLREPHEYWQRQIVDHRYESDTGIDLLGDGDALFHVGSVTPHVLKLKPNDTGSLIEFVEALGIVGLVTWVGGPLPGNLKQGFEVWEPLCVAVQDGDPTLYRPDLHAAWTHPVTVERYTNEHARLVRAWERAADVQEAGSSAPDQAVAALRHELIETQFKDPYPFEFVIAVTSITNQIVERPRHVLARSALELIDALTDQLPIRCERCLTPFPPMRTDQRYCTNRCQQKAYQQDYDKTPYRKAYHRMYRRHQRGTITDAEWIEWKNSNKRRNSLTGQGKKKPTRTDTDQPKET